MAALLQRWEDVIDPTDAFPHPREVAARMRAGNQVLFDRQVLEYPPPLEHLGHAAPDDIVRRQPVEPLAIQLDRALCHLAAFAAKKPGYRLQGRRLAGAIGAKQSGDTALLSKQRDAPQHEDHAVIDDLDIVEREHRIT